MQQILQPYPLHEGMLSFPASFIDRTLQQFTGEWQPGKPITLVVSRAQPAPGETGSQFVVRHLAHLKRAMPQFRLLKQTAATLGTGGAIMAGEQIYTSYKSNGQTTFQWQGIFLIEQQRALILSATSNRHLDEKFDPVWQQWLASFIPAQSAGQAT